MLYRFSVFFLIVISSTIIRVAVHFYGNFKIEKYRGCSHINKNELWVSIKLKIASY
jgi:hypothetical protein